MLQSNSQPSETLLSAYLSEAAKTPADLEQLAGQWRMARISLRIPNMSALGEDQNLIGKVRGAWGRALAQSASAAALAGRPCDWTAPCAYDLFFNAHGGVLNGVSLPKPFVMAADPDGADLILTITLFGLAVNWAGEAAEAMVRALRGGLDLRGDRKLVLEVSDRDIGLSIGQTLPGPMAGAVARFITPLQMREGADLHVKPGSLLKSLALRLSGLARWQGANLTLDLEALKADAAELDARSVWQDDRVQMWTRGSVAQGRKIPVAGMTGALVLPPLGAQGAGILSMGCHTHAGSKLSIGMGRYILHQFSEGN